MNRTPRFWLIAFAVATLLAICSVVFLYPGYSYSKGSMKWANMLAWQFTWWYCWLPLLPFILYLARRFPFDHSVWRQSLLIHIPSCIAISLIHLSSYIYVGWSIGGKLWLDPPKGISTASQELLFLIKSPSNVNFRTRIVLYAVIVLIAELTAVYRKSQQEELKTIELEKKLAEAKLQALKMQLHPHFLFNTLHSISALMYRDVRGAEEMIERLMKFLALTLENNGPQVVPLQKELEFLQCYLEIESVRFQDRLSIKMEIDSSALEAKVPNLITQPIVENAIRHGIASKTTAGRIIIKATSRDGRLCIQVLDNGPGLTKVREGLGLKNTRARLQQLYGDQQRLEFSNDSTGGLTVTLEIPDDRKAEYPLSMAEATL